jgi:hypothetical protein
MIQTLLIENNNLFQEIVKLAHEIPNDMDLGKAVRIILSENNRMNKGWVPVDMTDNSKID